MLALGGPLIERKNASLKQKAEANKQEIYLFSFLPLLSHDLDTQQSQRFHHCTSLYSASLSHIQTERIELIIIIDQMSVT